jgi:hypothetical protein
LKIRSTSDWSATTGPVINLQGKNPDGFATYFGGIKAYSLGADKGNLAFNVRKDNEQTDIEAMRIDSDGNVGIGTTSPDNKLSVNGNASAHAYEFYQNTASSASECIHRPTTGEFAIRANSQERLRIDSSGNVGIGASDPSGLFHLKGDTNNNGAELFLQVNNNNTTDTLGAIHFGNNINSTLTEVLSGTSVANDSSFLTLSTSKEGDLAEHMRITSSGNVGIGTTDPLYKLHLTDSGARNVILTSSEGLTSAGFGDYISTVSKASGASAAHGLLIGCYRHSTNDDFAGVIRFHQRNFVKQHLWFDNSGQLRVSTNGAHIGSDHEESTVIGTQTSDERLKDIEDNFEYGLDKVMQLKPIAYKLKEDESQVRKLGFGAQTTQDIVPEAVFSTSICIDGFDQDSEDENNQIPRSEDNTLGMEYVQLIPVLTKAIQEQQTIIEDLKSRIETLEQ